MADAISQMLDRYRVKIIKNRKDSRSSFRAKKFINPRDPNHDGTELDGVKAPYVIVPSFEIDYLKHICKSMGYIVSEPFIPGADPVPYAKVAEKKKKEVVEEPEVKK